MVIYYIGHVYLRPYVYSFCQNFQTLRLFPALETTLDCGENSYFMKRHRSKIKQLICVWILQEPVLKSQFNLQYFLQTFQDDRGGKNTVERADFQRTSGRRSGCSSNRGRKHVCQLWWKCKTFTHCNLTEFLRFCQKF